MVSIKIGSDCEFFYINLTVALRGDEKGMIVCGDLKFYMSKKEDGSFVAKIGILNFQSEMKKETEFKFSIPYSCKEEILELLNHRKNYRFKVIYGLKF